MAEYKQFEQRLQEELGVPPMPETNALYQMISQGVPLPGMAKQALHSDSTAKQALHSDSTAKQALHSDSSA